MQVFFELVKFFPLFLQAQLRLFEAPLANFPVFFSSSPLLPAVRHRHAPPRPFFSLPPQLAERAEYFWDDGTAEPEWFVDRGSSGGFAGGRPWAQSTASAAAQLAGVFLGIAVFIGGPAYIIGDSLKPAAPRWAYGLPYEREQRLAMMGIDGYQGSAANAGLNPQTMPDAEEEEE